MIKKTIQIVRIVMLVLKSPKFCHPGQLPLLRPVKYDLADKVICTRLAKIAQN